MIYRVGYMYKLNFLLILFFKLATYNSGLSMSLPVLQIVCILFVTFCYWIIWITICTLCKLRHNHDNTIEQDIRGYGIFNKKTYYVCYILRCLYRCVIQISCMWLLLRLTLRPWRRFNTLKRIKYVRVYACV